MYKSWLPSGLLFAISLLRVSSSGAKDEQEAGPTCTFLQGGRTLPQGLGWGGNGDLIVCLLISYTRLLFAKQCS